MQREETGTTSKTGPGAILQPVAGPHRIETKDSVLRARERPRTTSTLSLFVYTKTCPALTFPPICKDLVLK